MSAESSDTFGEGLELPKQLVRRIDAGHAIAIGDGRSVLTTAGFVITIEADARGFVCTAPFGYLDTDGPYASQNEAVQRYLECAVGDYLNQMAETGGNMNQALQDIGADLRTFFSRDIDAPTEAVHTVPLHEVIEFFMPDGRMGSILVLQAFNVELSLKEGKWWCVRNGHVHSEVSADSTQDAINTYLKKAAAEYAADLDVPVRTGDSEAHLPEKQRTKRLFWNKHFSDPIFADTDE